MADAKTETKNSAKGSRRKRTTARKSATSSAAPTEVSSKAKSPARSKPAKRTPAIPPTRPTRSARSTPNVLDAAARVLGETKKPMRCKEMVEVILAGKYWSTKGRTPAATLYSALLREIQRKGKDARFRKTERGKFALRQSAG